MILDKNSTPVEVNNGGENSAFSIAVNAKAFKVLSDTLYTNKIGSIVRELSCNAYDAHIMKANQATPFEIHLPDAFEPWFSVQDFGVGLSPEDVRTVFTVYFQSTKDQSNDTIGAFGLGAKTPFSYTDQFTISSVKAGLRTVYNAYITESGVPNIVVLFSEETQDATGVEIKLSVKREDYSKFKQEVLNQLKYFKIKPNILNGDVNFPSVDVYTIKTNNIGLTDHMYNEKPMIIQGNVGYPIDMTQLSGKIDNTNYNFLTSFSNTKVELYFEIGKIGVTASREGIEYTKGTLQNIDDKLTVIRSEIKDQILAKLANEATDWDRAVMLNNMPLFARVAPDYLIAGTKKYNNKLSFSLAKLFEIPTVGNPAPTSYNASFITHNAAVGRYDSYKPTARYQYGFDIEANSTQPLFVLTDKTTRLKEKIKYLFEQKRCNRILTVETNNGIYPDDLTDKIELALGGKANFIKLSDVVLPKKIGVSRVGVKVSTFYQLNTLNGTANKNMISSWDKMFDKINTINNKTVYVTIDTRATYISASDQLDLSVLEAIAKLQTVPNLVCIRDTEVKMKEVEANANLITLSDYIEHERVKYNTEENLKELRKLSLAECLVSAYSYDYKNKYNILKDKTPDHELTRFFTQVFEGHGKMTTDKVKVQKLRTIQSIIQIPPANNIVQTKKELYEKKLKKIISKYPLIKTWKHYSFDGTIPDEHYVLYLNSVQAALYKI